MMKIFLVNHKDSNNMNSWSGTPYFLSREIKRQFDNVLEYYLMEPPQLGKNTQMNGIENTLRPLGEELTNYLNDNDVCADYIWFLGGSSGIPFYEYGIPTVLWHDATWSTFLHGYSDAQQFNEFKNKFAPLYQWDRKVLEKTDILVYSSQYVAEASIRNYNISGNNVKVIPFGANLHASPSDRVLEEAMKLRLGSRELNFTFIGKDWQRKGLYQAGELVRQLNDTGITSRLNIIGAILDFDLSEFPYVTNWGILDKNKPEDFSLFELVLKGTHFLVHPAFSEPFGIALCEANAYGIPVVGTNVEGLMTIVRDGVNGFLFDGENFAAQASEKIREICMDFQNNYPCYAKGALNEYQTRLNWRTSVASMKNLLLANSLV
jgi:glycosyltransferase involved in cell wall biosynthesis